MKTDDIKITPKWSKSKEDIWDSVFEGLEETPKVIEMAPRKDHCGFMRLHLLLQ